MIFSQRFIICSGYLLWLLCTTGIVSGAELIGVVPFANQRYQKQDDWLGYYIQARIQANLSNNSNWQFYPQNVISLWNFRLDRSLPISPQTTLLIEGSFQRVAGLGYIALKIKRRNSREERHATFERQFEGDDPGRAIDELSTQVGRWIDPEFTIEEQVPLPEFGSRRLRAIYRLRKVLFEQNSMPDVQLILFLEDVVKEDSPFHEICDLSEAMLISAQLLNTQEQKMVYSRVETLLRRAILKNRNQSRLYVLLAETYYLNGSYASWIEKTSDDAIRLGDLSGLGYLLKVLVAEPDDRSRAENMEHLRLTNPWLLSGIANRFQNGLLKEELHRLVLETGKTR